MFGIEFSTVDQSQRVVQATQRAKYRNFSHAAASIRKDVIPTLKVAEGPSAPGSPPHTHPKRRGRGVLPRSITYAATQEDAVIGPRASVAGDVGYAHEIGGAFRNETFDARPFMGPALERNADRFGSDWEGSIGE